MQLRLNTSSSCSTTALLGDLNHINFHEQQHSNTAKRQQVISQQCDPHWCTYSQAEANEKFINNSRQPSFHALFLFPFPPTPHNYHQLLFCIQGARAKTPENLILRVHLWVSVHFRFKNPHMLSQLITGVMNSCWFNHTGMLYSTWSHWLCKFPRANGWCILSHHRLIY